LKTTNESKDAESEPILKIGHVANILGVPTARIRAWESESLITPYRTESGQRRYSVHDVKQLEKIRKLLDGKSITFLGVRTALASACAEHNDDLPSHDTRDFVGQRVQMLRQRQRMSLRDLSRAVKISPSALSAFERGLSRPSTGRISRIAHVLGTTVPELLGRGRPKDQITVRVDKREVLPLNDEGVRIELLYRTTTVLQSQFITIEPGCGLLEPITHTGEDFVTVVEGEIDVILDSIEVFHLDQGDSMTFPSTRAHGFQNRGSRTTRLVWVNTPPTF
jgi:DNA-binding transcriptional MerR regulator/mannose-6-phosphate isomerase-like protein (cupin superfamily)